MGVKPSEIMEEDYAEQKKEENVYSEEGREESIDGGEISPEEEAFLAGYDEAENEELDKDKEDEDEDKE